jgi:hypothetical protein
VPGREVAQGRINHRTLAGQRAGFLHIPHALCLAVALEPEAIFGGMRKVCLSESGM